MKNLLLACGLLFAVSVSAQEQLSVSKPLYLIDGAITTENALKNVSPDKIQSVSVYKTAENIPDSMKSFRTNVANGIIDIHVKSADKDATYYTVGEINILHNFRESTPVLFAGNLLTDPKTKILKSAVKEFKAIPDNDSEIIEVIPN